MRKTHRNNIRTMLVGVVLPLWLFSFLFGRSSVAVVEVAQSQALRTGAAQSAERRSAMDLNVDNLARPRLKPSKSDPFTTFVPKPRVIPTVAAPPPPPPAPVAPALPFTYLGRMVENDNTVLFLSKQDQSYSVKIAGIVDKNYRVESINDDQVVFTYLPLNIQQTLSFGRRS